MIKLDAVFLWCAIVTLLFAEVTRWLATASANQEVALYGYVATLSFVLCAGLAMADSRGRNG